MIHSVLSCQYPRGSSFLHPQNQGNRSAISRLKTSRKNGGAFFWASCFGARAARFRTLCPCCCVMGSSFGTPLSGHQWNPLGFLWFSANWSCCGNAICCVVHVGIFGICRDCFDGCLFRSNRQGFSFRFSQTNQPNDDSVLTLMRPIRSLCWANKRWTRWRL